MTNPTIQELEQQLAELRQKLAESPGDEAHAEALKNRIFELELELAEQRRP